MYSVHIWIWDSYTSDFRSLIWVLWWSTSSNNFQYTVFAGFCSGGVEKDPRWMPRFNNFGAAGRLSIWSPWTCLPFFCILKPFVKNSSKFVIDYTHWSFFFFFYFLCNVLCHEALEQLPQSQTEECERSRECSVQFQCLYICIIYIIYV